MTEEKTMFEKIAQWFVEKNFASVRSGMLYVSVWLTWEASKWGARYAELALDKGVDGTQTSIVLVAAAGPITAFTAFVYKWYSDSRP